MLPMPDRADVYAVDDVLRDNPSKQFIAGRGCPYDCAYCYNHAFRELFPYPTLRRRQVQAVIDEILAVRSRWPLRFCVFQDDCLPLDLPWFRQFAVAYRSQVWLPYSCMARADSVTAEVADLLAYSGCRTVSWSIETGNEVLRATLLNRRMTNASILACAHRLRQRGIRFRIGNMVGLPREKWDQMYQTLALNRACHADLSHCHLFAPLPGLRLTAEAVRLGVWTERGALPANFAHGPVCHFSPKLRKRCHNLAMLFSWLARSRLSQASVELVCDWLPEWVCRLVERVVWALNMRRLYSVTGGWWLVARLAWREWRGRG